MREREREEESRAEQCVRGKVGHALDRCEVVVVVCRGAVVVVVVVVVVAAAGLWGAGQQGAPLTAVTRGGP